jgi:hypothetical protein
MPRDKVADALVEALQQALACGAEQRLFRSGKIDGLFPGRTGTNGDAAARALRDGLLEITRSETRGKSTVEWVRLTPRGVEFLHEHESPIRALEHLRDTLRLNEAAIPVWLSDMKREVGAMAERLEQDARRWAERLEGLSRRVGEALDRLEKQKAPLPEELATAVPWASAALDYLDRRRSAGAPECDLPELFEAVRRSSADLSITSFHDGLRRLQERRALRLLPVEESWSLTQPEYALFDGRRVFYRAAV